MIEGASSSSDQQLQLMSEDDPDINDILYPPCYFKVIHKAGVRVREAPLQAYDPHSQVIPLDTIVYGQRVGDYVQLLDGRDLDTSWPINYWVTYQARGIQGLEVCHKGSTDVGRWYYRIKCERGMQFLSKPRLDSDRHERIHEMGSIVVAIKKYVPPGSIMIFCELENNLGHIIEDFSGALLEQLDGEVALEAVSPEERDIGLAHFVVVYRGGLVLRSRPDLSEDSIITSTPRRRQSGYNSSTGSDSSDSVSSISEPGSGRLRNHSSDSLYHRSDSNDSINSLISKSTSSEDGDDHSLSKTSVASASAAIGRSPPPSSYQVNDEFDKEEEKPKRRASFPSRYSSINNSPIEDTVHSRRRSSFRHHRQHSGNHRHHRRGHHQTSSVFSPKLPSAPPITKVNILPLPDDNTPSPGLPPSSSSSLTSSNFDQSKRRRRPKKLTIMSKKDNSSVESVSPRTPSTPQTPQDGQTSTRVGRRRKSSSRRRRSGSISSFRAGIIACGAMIEACEVLKPAGVDATFVKLSDGRGWVCAVRGRLLAAQAVSPPNVKEGEFWFQVTSVEPIEVVEKPNPLAYATGRRMGLGMVFVSHCIVCPAGGKEGVAYAEIDSEEVTGWVAFIAQQQSGGSALLIKDTKVNEDGSEEHISPLRSVAPPVWVDDPGLYQMLDCNGTLANLNPHHASSFIGEMIPPYAIVRVDGTLTITPLSSSTQSSTTPSSISSNKPTVADPARMSSCDQNNNNSNRSSNVSSSDGTTKLDDINLRDGQKMEGGASGDVGTLVLHNVDIRDKSNTFLKLSGRPGWVAMNRLDVLRVTSTPTVERGEFIYKVMNSKLKSSIGEEDEEDRGVMVLHGPVLTADHINLSLSSGTMVRGRVRLRPYHGMHCVVEEQIEKKRQVQLQAELQVDDNDTSSSVVCSNSSCSNQNNDVDNHSSSMLPASSQVVVRDDGPIFIGGHFGEENRPGWVLVSDRDTTYLELVSEVTESVAYGKTLSEYTEMYERRPEQGDGSYQPGTGGPQAGGYEEDENSDDDGKGSDGEERYATDEERGDSEDEEYEINNEYDEDKKCIVT